MDWLKLHWKDITDIIVYIIAIASIIVKATPNLKDDNILLPLVKFVGKFIALNTNSPADRPK